MERKKFISLILLIVLTVLACRGRQGEDLVLNPEEPPYSGPIGSNFEGTIDLDSLSSYRLKLTTQFEGMRGPQKVDGRIDLFVESTQEPPARHMRILAEGAATEELGGINTLEAYIVNDVVYIYKPSEGSWYSISGEEVDAFEAGYFDPATLLELPQTAHCDETSVTVNEVSATHCRFDKRNISQQGATYNSLQGEAWIATQGNYVLKYQVVGEGFQTLSSGGLFDTGNVWVDYEVIAINEDLTITLPIEAEGAKDLNAAE